MFLLFLSLWVFSSTADDPIRVKEISGKLHNGSVSSGQVDVWTQAMNHQQQDDFWRVRISLKEKDFDNPTEGFLQATISNGRDSVAFALPERIGNGTLIYSTTRFLLPLTTESKKKLRKTSERQRRTVTIQTYLDYVDYELGFQHLADAQYQIKINDGRWNLSDQRVGLAKPQGYYWRTTDVKRAQISIRSSDFFCGVLYLHNTDASLFRRTGELANLPNNAFRSISFSKRLDVSLDESVLTDTLYLYLLLQPEDSICDPNASRRNVNEIKKFSVEILVEPAHDFLPKIGAFIAVFLITPVVLALYGKRPSRKTISTEETPALIDLHSTSVSGGIEEGQREHVSAVHSADDNQFLNVAHIPDSVPIDLLPPPAELEDKPNSHFDATFALYILPALLLGCVQYTQSVATGRLEDTCYHNYGCAKRLGHFVAFNHITSNIGYVINGSYYLAFIGLRKLPNKMRGVFQNHGLETALGCALICQGVASAIYHVCPSRFSFNFDTPFMQVISVVIMLKLYGNRHGVISAHTANKLIGAVIAGNVAVSIFDHSFLLRSAIFLVHMTAVCLILMRISGLSMARKSFVKDVGDSIVTLKKSPFGWVVLTLNTFISLGHVFNLGLTAQSNQLMTLLCIGNMITYLIYYFAMKFISKEKINWLSGISATASLGLWAAAGYFFFQEESNWTLTPAQSRNLNSDCLFLGFYDRHDMWHLLSAQAMLASLIALSTIDDAQRASPRPELAVF